MEKGKRWRYRKKKWDSVAFPDRQGCKVDVPAWALRQWPHRLICRRDEALRHDECGGTEQRARRVTFDYVASTVVVAIRGGSATVQVRCESMDLVTVMEFLLFDDERSRIISAVYSGLLNPEE
ncbi:uncharacterized protein HKW66_Vig0224150 [Vigna angularis]|uniref:Uncharacterized protein n=1 Tax=Phaseolus angularis TaxID=3914 RepID=A0A8T0K0G4_PHAAN|nr:uncharacterized protein HKW66_Vig0224150 [Vigna angularis]